MSEQSDLLAEMATRHADLILRSVGTKLANYMERSQIAAKCAVLDAIEEAYRAGAKFADDRAKSGDRA